MMQFYQILNYKIDLHKTIREEDILIQFKHRNSIRTQNILSKMIYSNLLETASADSVIRPYYVQKNRRC